MKTVEIHSSCGEIRGIELENHLEYRSIRYATSQRFEYPIQVDSWDGIYDATQYKDCSYQRRSFEDDAVCNQFYHKEFRENLSFTYSEDSLFLNIWSPKDAKQCPVLIYIHGGSFTGGSSNEAHISGIEAAKNGIMFVSFNYRLGPFGFCSHPDLTDEHGVCGNYGLFDQYTAMKWVKEHIESFGGNPKKITIMGQSAGSMSVDIHSSCDLEKGWFSGIVMSSCAGLQRYFIRPWKPKSTLRFWKVVMEHANVTTVQELKEVDPKTLYYAWFDACKQFKFDMPYTFPVYDGKLLTKKSFRKRKLSDVPYMIGMTSSDLMPFVLKTIITRWIRTAERTNKNNCYAYYFTRNLPGDHAGAWHSSDLLYFFSTLKNNWRPFEETDYKLSNQMSQALFAFVKNQDPNCSAIPYWEHGGRKPMTFCEHTEQVKWNTKQLIKNTIKKGSSE